MNELMKPVCNTNVKSILRFSYIAILLYLHKNVVKRLSGNMTIMAAILKHPFLFILFRIVIMAYEQNKTKNKKVFCLSCQILKLWVTGVWNRSDDTFLKQ